MGFKVQRKIPTVCFWLLALLFVLKIFPEIQRILSIIIIWRVYNMSHFTLRVSTEVVFLLVIGTFLWISNCYNTIQEYEIFLKGLLYEPAMGKKVVWVCVSKGMCAMQEGVCVKHNFKLSRPKKTMLRWEENAKKQSVIKRTSWQEYGHLGFNERWEKCWKPFYYYFPTKE